MNKSRISHILLKEKPKLHILINNSCPQDFHSNINLLKHIELILKSSNKTLEIGAGWSTVVFAFIGTRHIVIDPIKQEFEQIKKYCTKKNIPTSKIKFITGKSELILPKIVTKEKLDFILIDGNHAFPFPTIDWYYTSLILKVNGYMVIDDIDIKSCNILYQFMKSDRAWKLIIQKQNFAIFQKININIHADWWRTQNFSQRKIGLFGAWEKIKFDIRQNK